MGAEIGATCSVFAYDAKMADYLRATGRAEVAGLADGIREHLRPDDAVYADPASYYDELLELDLDTLEPYVNGPYTPDLATPVSKVREAVEANGWPAKLEVALIGSCTNSSYEDISRSASIVKDAVAKGLKAHSEFTITPGSEQVRYTIERDGFIRQFEAVGGVVLANACGPCIGQWARHIDDPNRKNTIITSFNRNFAKRNDGYAGTHAFVASPELVTAMAIAGTIAFNPLTDKLKNDKGEEVMLSEPQGFELPPRGFAVEDAGYQAPAEDGSGVQVAVAPDSKRLQLLEPFAAWEGSDLKGLRLLIKAKGKCTTDHISMAGPWLKYRGHLENISGNLFLGAINAFTGAAGEGVDQLDGQVKAFPEIARHYHEAGQRWVAVGDENWGEGSSREHAAMEPRYRGCVAIIVRSFARIHEANLKKQGVLPLTFADPSTYEAVGQDDRISIVGLADLAPGRPVTCVLHRSDGTTLEFQANHTMSDEHVEWFRAGSALNIIRSRTGG